MSYERVFYFRLFYSAYFTSLSGCLFICPIISVIAEAKDQHEDWL